jgi:predicted membrane channel-forming protein YqfA (hemolysin III family)
VRFVWNGGGAMEYLEIMFYVAMGIAVISMTAAMWDLLRWR